MMNRHPKTKIQTEPLLAPQERTTVPTYRAPPERALIHSQTLAGPIPKDEPKLLEPIIRVR